MRGGENSKVRALKPEFLALWLQARIIDTHTHITHRVSSIIRACSVCTLSPSLAIFAEFGRFSPIFVIFAGFVAFAEFGRFRRFLPFSPIFVIRPPSPCPEAPAAKGPCGGREAEIGLGKNFFFFGPK